MWLYSEKCIDCFREYVSKFPEVFEFLNANSSSNEVFADEVFPDT